jgi:uncharacterized membrane protein YozB (DUF420 family)
MASTMTRSSAPAATRGRKARRQPAPPPPRVPVATLQIYRHGVWLPVVFGLAMLVAFWPSYFSRLSLQPTYHPHAHGLTMTLWCALLVAQAWLIRTGNRQLHRRIGRLGWALVPLMVLATVNFLHFRLQGAPRLDAVTLYFMALVLNALVAFLVLYGLAMYHRRQPPVHGRYMLCTIFPLLTPVTDRLVGPYAPSVVALVPRIDGMPVVPVAGFVLAHAVLATLAVWDWRSGQRTAVFPVAIGGLLLYHVSVLTFHRSDLWRTFGAWFVGLPLS